MTWWKMLLPLALLAPLAGYGAGVLTRPAPEPQQRTPLLLESVQTSTSPTPDLIPGTRITKRPAPSPTIDEPRLVYPDTDDLDDDDLDDDDLDDDEDDDRDEDDTDHDDADDD